MKGCLITIFVLAGLFVFLASVGGSGSTANRRMSSPARASEQVTLRPAAGNSVVQMFDTIASDNASVINRFPAGTRCNVLDGPLAAQVSGPAMRFYHLSCAGAVGYVNAQWVD